MALFRAVALDPKHPKADDMMEAIQFIAPTLKKIRTCPYLGGEGHHRDSAEADPESPYCGGCGVRLGVIVMAYCQEVIQ